MDNFLKLNDDELKKLHSDLLTILLELDRICKENNIRYFLSDGTLLGAVRHKGFIPWDDDVDVHMLRDDYDKFCKICNETLNEEKFFFQNQETDNEYNWVYGKLRMKDTSFIRCGQEHIKAKDGIFIDIFPIDKASNNIYKQNITNKVCKLCRKILYAPVGSVSCSSFFEKSFFSVLNLIPRDKAIKVFNKFSKSNNLEDTRLFTSNNLVYANSKLYLLKEEWYENHIDMEFEGCVFPVPVGYNEILSLTYGEYLRLPPKDKRMGRCYSTYIKFSDGTEVNIKNRG